MSGEVNIGAFFAFYIAYLFWLSLRDYTVTGLLAKGCPPDGKFHAYALCTTGEVFAVAMWSMAHAPFPSLTGFAMFATVLMGWLGGWLDFIYWVAAGGIPDENRVWTWIPKIFPKLVGSDLVFDHPTTKQYAAWAAGWLLVDGLLWLAVMLT